MKKSTVLLIFMIYVASIVIIGFFGMRIKIYDEVKYINKIEISVEAEKSEMYELTLLPEKDKTTQNDVYNLKIYFTDYAEEGEFFDEGSGTNLTKKYLPISFIPKITYDTGEEGANVEGITYNISNQKLIDNKSVELENNGTMICFKPKISFYVYIDPVSKGRNGTGVIIHVFVI